MARPACRATQVVLLPGPVSPSSSTAAAVDTPVREPQVRTRATNLVLHPLFTLAALAVYIALALSPVPNYWYVPVMFAALLFGVLGFDSFVHRFLELRPLVFLGDISYSVYLWHWPLLVLVPFATGRPLTAATGIARSTANPPKTTPQAATATRTSRGERPTASPRTRGMTR